jgi:hypothetical protein
MLRVPRPAKTRPAAPALRSKASENAGWERPARGALACADAGGEGVGSELSGGWTRGAAASERAPADRHREDVHRVDAVPDTGTHPWRVSSNPKRT